MHDCMVLFSVSPGNLLAKWFTKACKILSGHMLTSSTPDIWTHTWTTHHGSNYKLKQLSWRQQNTPGLVKYIWQPIEMRPVALHLTAGAIFPLVSIYWNTLIPIRPICSGAWLRSVRQSQIFCVIFTNAKIVANSPCFATALKNSLHSLLILHNQWQNRQPKKTKRKLYLWQTFAMTNTGITTPRLVLKVIA